MCIFEYTTGPRTLGKDAHSRFQVQSQFAKVFSKLYSSHASYHHAWRAKNAHLEAASEFFSAQACPVTLLRFDFSSCASACTKRMLAVNTILQWKHDTTSHAAIIRNGFDTYVQAWENLSLVVLPAPSSAEAFNRADRLRMELMPSSTEMSEAIMDSLNWKIRDHRPATGITGKERTELALQSIATMGSLGASSTSAVTSTDGSSNSACLKKLENAVSSGLRPSLIMVPSHACLVPRKATAHGPPNPAHATRKWRHTPGCPQATRMWHHTPRHHTSHPNVAQQRINQAAHSAGPPECGTTPHHTEGYHYHPDVVHMGYTNLAHSRHPNVAL